MGEVGEKAAVSGTKGREMRETVKWMQSVKEKREREQD